MLTFQKLWDSHPTITGQNNPCTTNGRANFSDQCAIRVGVALAACGVDMSKVPGARYCWQHKRSAGHVLAAEELANGLRMHPFFGLGNLQKITPENFKDKIALQTGIIFFKDYYKRDGETFRNRSGDHIDLWNGSRLTTLLSWFRIQGGLSWEGVWSKHGDSKEIWFWRVM